MIKKSPFDYKKFGPLKQGVLTILFVTLISLICWIFRLKSMQAWCLILSPIFLFACYNPILGAFQQKLLHYMAISILTYIALGMYIYISGNFVSDVSFRDSDELQRIAVVAVIFYILLNLLCLMFRSVLYLLDQIDE